MFLFEVHPLLSDRFGDNYWEAEKKIQSHNRTAKNKKRIRRKAKGNENVLVTSLIK